QLAGVPRLGLLPVPSTLLGQRQLRLRDRLGPRRVRRLLPLLFSVAVVVERGGGGCRLPLSARPSDLAGFEVDVALDLRGLGCAGRRGDLGGCCLHLFGGRLLATSVLDGLGPRFDLLLWFERCEFADLALRVGERNV